MFVFFFFLLDSRCIQAQYSIPISHSISIDSHINFFFSSPSLSFFGVSPFLQLLMDREHSRFTFKGHYRVHTAPPPQVNISNWKRNARVSNEIAGTEKLHNFPLWFFFFLFRVLLWHPCICYAVCFPSMRLFSGVCLHQPAHVGLSHHWQIKWTISINAPVAVYGHVQSAWPHYSWFTAGIGSCLMLFARM